MQVHECEVHKDTVRQATQDPRKVEYTKRGGLRHDSSGCDEKNRGEHKGMATAQIGTDGPRGQGADDAAQGQERRNDLLRNGLEGVSRQLT